MALAEAVRSTMARLSLRNAVTGDEGSIRRVVAVVLREHGFVLEPAGIDADLEDVVVHYHNVGGLFRVLVDDGGEIVGCGGLVPLSVEDAELRKMYFLSHARGLGYGRLLLEDLIAHARTRGFHRVVLETASRLTRAGALYRQFGFVDVGRSHFAARCDAAMALNLR
jgi:GNAT superfamily N-acetyltransferase